MGLNRPKMKGIIVNADYAFFLNELPENEDSLFGNMDIIFWKTKLNQHRISMGLQIFILINSLI